MEQYIDEHENTISGSTYRGYCQYIKFFESLLDCNIERIESEDIQRLVNKWSVKLTKKTIKNRHSNSFFTTFNLVVLIRSQCKSLLYIFPFTVLSILTNLV